MGCSEAAKGADKIRPKRADFLFQGKNFRASMKREDTVPPYSLIRSSRRSMAIEVRPGGRVLVRVPKEVSDGEARAFVLAHRARVERAVERMRAKAAPQPPGEEEIKELRRRARAEMPGRVEYWCKRLGLKAGRVKITSAQTRWGSCSSKGNICFSYLLMRCPDEFIDYVALHEVAHLTHPNHGRGFYALIERHMPDYKRRRKLSGPAQDKEDA